MSGAEIDLMAVRDNDVESGVSHGAALLAYTDAVMARDADAIARTRDVVESLLGKPGVTEAAAVMAMFNVVDRVADATGIPIDAGFTRDMRYSIGSELGMDHLTPEERASR
jgi:predicted homoserine dehydrogenase-like protein